MNRLPLKGPQSNVPGRLLMPKRVLSPFGHVAGRMHETRAIFLPQRSPRQVQASLRLCVSQCDFMSMRWYHALSRYEYAMRVDEDVCLQVCTRIALLNEELDIGAGACVPL